MKHFIILPLLLLPLSLFATEYQVKKGEHLGEILRAKGFSPIWGRDGYVKKAIELNPDKIKQNGNFIVNEARLKLPESGQPLQQTVEFKNSAPQVLQLKTEEVAIGAALSTKVMYLEGKDKSSGMSDTLQNAAAPGLILSFDHKYKETRAYGFFFSNHRLDFNKPSGKSLKEGRKSYNEFGLSYTHDFQEARAMNVSLSLEERPLLFFSGSDLVIERATIPKLAFTYAHQFLEKKYLKLAGMIGAAVLFPMNREDYHINLGHNIYTGIKGRYELSEKVELTSSLTADFSEQHSSPSENKYSEVAFNLGILFVTDAPKL